QGGARAPPGVTGDPIMEWFGEWGRPSHDLVRVGVSEYRTVPPHIGRLPVSGGEVLTQARVDTLGLPQPDQARVGVELGHCRTVPFRRGGRVVGHGDDSE